MPGQHPIRLNEDNLPMNELLPRGAFSTREELDKYCQSRAFKSPDLKVRHVRRYKKVK